MLSSSPIHSKSPQKAWKILLLFPLYLVLPSESSGFRGFFPERSKARPLFNAAAIIFNPNGAIL